MRHFQLTGWSNYGLVDQLDELLELVRRVWEETEGAGGPMLVHCSGGLGRSGTFTVILALYNMLRRDLAVVENYVSGGGGGDGAEC